MSFLFENQGSGAYLVYELNENEELDTMSLGMLSNNKIPGLIPLLFTRMNYTQYIKYNVSSKISVKQFFMGTVNKKQLLGVFRGIAEAVISAEEFMINPANIILDTEFIFSDVSSCETVLVCLPVKGAVKRTELKVFLRDIMFNTQFDQTENCDHVAKIINFLNSSVVFSVYEFKKLLDKISSSSAQDILEVKASVPQIGQEHNFAPNMWSASYQTAQNPPPVANAPSPAAVPASKAPAPMPAARANSAAFPVPGQSNGAKAVSKNNGSAHRMAVPGMNTPAMAAPSAASECENHNNGEKISLMYLLQHYNKENAEKYKAQKKAKKAAAQLPQAASPISVNIGNIPGAGNIPVNVPGAPNYQGANSPSVGNGMAFSSQNNTVGSAPVAPSASKTALPSPAPFPQPIYVGRPVSSSPAENEHVDNNRAGYADFGDTQYIQPSCEDSETAFFMPGAQNGMVQPYLLSKRNNERIPIIGNFFRLGRDEGFNDYVIHNNNFVGHSHCHIFVKNGEYFIVDDNSKNRTYVNETPIQPGKEIKLVHGQSIKLANEEFEFKIF